MEPHRLKSVLLNASLGGKHGRFLCQQRDERGGIGVRRTARRAHADQRLRDIGAKVRKCFGQCGGKSSWRCHALWRDSKNGFAEPVDGICSIFKRGSLRIIAASCDDNLERPAGMKQGSESVACGMNSKLRRDGGKRLWRLFRGRAV